MPLKYAMQDTKPLIKELPFAIPSEVFSALADEPWNILLESSDQEHKDYGTNRFSYIGFRPFKTISTKNDVFNHLKQQAAEHQAEHIPHLPPFQGGIMGLLNYDNTHHLGFYDVVQAFDHEQEKSWLICSGENAEQRAQEYLNAIDTKKSHNFAAVTNFQSNLSKEEYLEKAKRAIQYIKDGDIFEVNIAQRFAAKRPDTFNEYALYQKIKKENPATFAAFFRLEGRVIVSSSPERFIEIKDGLVETRPIKGTRKRGQTADEDQRLALDLINSEKDHAENVMIVDLMRNDLSRCCEDDSINVPVLCGHEIYPNVHHLVSVIKGKLKSDKTSFDLLQDAFPGGSITGAPKIRSMDIIKELEPDPRDAYCGSLICASFDGKHLDSSILIRTYVIKDNLITFHGGGAITIDSDPESEYVETLNKIKALKQAVESS